MTDEGARILVVDDEPAIRRLIQVMLTAHGYRVDQANSGADAIQSAQIVRPDLILLDLSLPDLDGLDVLKCLREWSHTPILILSVREDESEKIAALEAGADDYMTKPFGAGELRARIRALLRRIQPQEQQGSVFTTGDLTVDLAHRKVFVKEVEVQLTPTEYELLKVLIFNNGKILTHRQLIREVWGGSHYGDTLHTLRVNISNLRRKLERDSSHPELIVTEPSVGYLLRAVPAKPEPAQESIPMRQS